MSFFYIQRFDLVLSNASLRKSRCTRYDFISCYACTDIKFFVVVPRVCLIFLLGRPQSKLLPLPDPKKIMVPLRPHQIYLDAAKIKAYSQANPQHKLNFSG